MNYYSKKSIFTFKELEFTNGKKMSKLISFKKDDSIFKTTYVKEH
jgi:hypothetical protein